MSPSDALALIPRVLAPAKRLALRLRVRRIVGRKLYTFERPTKDRPFYLATLKRDRVFRSSDGWAWFTDEWIAVSDDWLLAPLRSVFVAETGTTPPMK